MDINKLLYNRKQSTTAQPTGEKLRQTLYFNDGKRQIDMILVHPCQDSDALQNYRRNFEFNLLKAGIQIEKHEFALDGTFTFVKLHLPQKEKRRYSEALSIRVPSIYIRRENRMKTREDSEFRPSWRFLDDDDDDTGYTQGQRSAIVWQLLLRIPYEKGPHKIGIKGLLKMKAYVAAYPLHDGKHIYNEDDSIREVLFYEWAHIKSWHKVLPLWLIKTYFGEKLGMFFAWLSFYTKMLVPAAIFGVLISAYGIIALWVGLDDLSVEACDLNKNGNLTICPLCDQVCDYVTLYDSCTFSKLSFLFDNFATIIFAVFMSVWGTIYLALWKRRCAVLTWKWDLKWVVDDFEIRPQYQDRTSKKRYNPITDELEPYMPRWSRALRYMFSGAIVLLMVFVVLAAILAIIIYKISILALVYKTRLKSRIGKQGGRVITYGTASVIHLIVSIILQRVYGCLAIWLTEIENPRTQEEFNTSYSFKLFSLQAVNFYTPLFYIAFFKGQFYIEPGDQKSRSNSVLRISTDVCDPVGCMCELGIQLAVINVGRQLFSNINKMLFPLLKIWWNRMAIQAEDMAQVEYERWEEDFILDDYEEFSLIHDYLDVATQYGFLTLFVAAFPLAPLFAWINNSLELRVDAYNLTVQMRRPLAERQQNIDSWVFILQAITYCSFATNAFLIAFTSEFIPKIVYMVRYSPNGSLQDYIKFALTPYNVSNYPQELKPQLLPGVEHPDVCLYRSARYVFTGEHPPQFWLILVSRLIFVVVFEHIVFALTGIFAYLIPAEPMVIRMLKHQEKMQTLDAHINPYGI